MPNLKDINKKIASLHNTRKITSAMKMIAATKLRKAQNAFEKSEPYAKNLNQIMQKVSSNSEIEHPLFERRKNVKKIHLVVITSDRGLCGGFNNSIIKEATNFISSKTESGAEVSLSFFGKKGYESFKKKDHTIKNYFEDLINKPKFEEVGKIGADLIKEFLSGDSDETYFLFNEFKSTILQVSNLVQLLPVVNDSASMAESSDIDYILEPSPKEIIEELVVSSVKFNLFRSLLNSSTSEHAARMTAMDAATNNGNDMIEKYTLQRNKARQAAITTELVEIVSGAESLNS